MFVRKGSSVLAPLILTLSVVLLSRNCIIRFSCSSCFLSIVSKAADMPCGVYFDVRIIENLG